MWRWRAWLGLVQAREITNTIQHRTFIFNPYLGQQPHFLSLLLCRERKCEKGRTTSTAPLTYQTEGIMALVDDIEQILELNNALWRLPILLVAARLDKIEKQLKNVEGQDAEALTKKHSFLMYLFDRNKIEAIRVIKALTGCTLVEGKAFVDQMMDAMDAFAFIHDQKHDKKEE
jgi:ribosomal protein L7/L12